MNNLYLLLFCFFTSNFILFAQGDCNIEVGTLPSESQYICVESSIPLQNEGVVLGEQDALFYLIHTTSNLLESSIIDTFLIDSLAWNRSENEQIGFNEKYFVSAVAGLDENTDGIPDDLMHECTVVSESMPVVWAADIRFDYDIDCDSESPYFVDTLCDYRGLSGFFAGQVSNIGGNGGEQRIFTITTDDNTFEVQSGEPFSLSVGEEAILSWVFEINIRDNWNCVDYTINIDEVGNCHPNNYTDIQFVTGMPTEQQVVCPNEMTDIEVACIYKIGFFGPPDATYAILPTPEYDENAIIAVSEEEGVFSHQYVAEYWNTQLYVFATVIGPPLFGGDLQLFVSDYPTPVIFLAPFDIDLQIEDCNAENATITLSPIGGYPAYNQMDTDKYLISSDLFEGELTLGETTTIEWAVPPMEMDPMITFQVSDSYGCMQSIEVENPCLSVGISDFSLASFQLENLYPIPAKDVLNLEVQSQRAQELELELFDIGGKKVLTQSRTLQLGKNQFQWEIGGIPTGVYYLQVTTEEGSMVKKVILE